MTEHAIPPGGHVDPVQWFAGLGECHKCGKPAHGKLMGPRNESYGVYCTRCAEARLVRARKQQDAALWGKR
jgi:DNA-directed RNA polymerase subunit RPC12/RpoP